MDQVKKVLQVVLKYRFWLICGVVLLVPVGGWFQATARLKKEFEERKTAIKGKFDAGKTIIDTQNHPNQFSEKGMDGYVVQLKNEVLAAWQYQYKKQEQILVWPKELGDDFIRQVEKYQPIESLAFPTPTKDEIPVRFRERYRDYIKEELPKLAEVIGSQWRATQSAGYGSGDMSGMFGMGMDASNMPGGYTGDMGMGAGGAVPGMMLQPGAAANAVKEIVLWNPADQSALQNQRFEWSGFPDKAPRTLDVLYSQEDLWVLKALMQIIARTNRDATGRYNALVKEVRYIGLGRTVGGSTGQVVRLVPGLLGGMMGGMGGDGMYSGMGGSGMGMDAAGMSTDGSTATSDPGGAAMGATGMPGNMSGMASGNSADGSMMMTPASLDPANYRYVDNDYKPIPSERLRTVLSPDNRNPDDAFLVVAKRIPIRVGLVMDQRKVHRLVTECGNASLMVEVRQVRLNRQGSASATGGYGAGGEMGMNAGFGAFGGFGGDPSGGMPSGDPMSGGPAGFGGFGGMPGMDAGSSGMSGYGMEGDYGAGVSGMDRDKSPYDLPVEIYGMVYIYNPVRIEQLGIEQKEAGETEAGTPPAAETAAPPPTAPAAAPAASPTTGA